MHQFIVSMERIASQSAWTQKNRFDSFAPLRVNVAAQWLVDGVSLFPSSPSTLRWLTWAARLLLEPEQSHQHGQRPDLYPRLVVSHLSHSLTRTFGGRVINCSGYHLSCTSVDQETKGSDLIISSNAKPKTESRSSSSSSECNFLHEIYPTSSQCHFTSPMGV